MDTGRKATSTNHAFQTNQQQEGAPEWRSKNVEYQKTLQHLRSLARHATIPILLEGESGTGKSTLAHAIHTASPRRRGPFHAVVLSSLEDGLAGSDLFGHVQGAFTGAGKSRLGAFIAAAGGTLFLDEIGKATNAVQMKLLGAVERRVVTQIGADQERKADVRIIAATNIPLQELVQAGRFLPDLEARLVSFRAELPPLRHRREDISDLALQLVARHAADFGFKVAPLVDPALVRAMELANWEHNIRGLDAAVQRLLLHAEMIGADTLSLDLCNGALGFLLHAPEEKKVAKLSREEVRNELRPGEPRAEMAKRLGISVATLFRHLRV